MQRTIQKLDAFINIAKTLASLSTSSKLKVGCVIFKKDFSKIASIGYNGAYKNAPIHDTTGTEEESLAPGKSGFIHAEINAIAKFREYTTEDYVVLVTHSPCEHCAKVLANAGFKHVYWIEEYRITEHLSSIFSRTDVKYGKVHSNFLRDVYDIHVCPNCKEHALSAFDDNTMLLSYPAKRAMKCDKCLRIEYI
jgi:dCMP deaminase